jgi:polar amino acid transport system substrate-binding protein
MAANISPSVRSDLAPLGKLRVGINYGNPVLATRDPDTGDLAGVAVELAREAARRAGLPVELVGFESAGQMVQGLQAGSWDIAFLAIDPARAGEIRFTAPYLEIEGAYLVPAGSPLCAVADVDREGVRIGISSKSAYDLFLSRSLRRAQLARAPDPNAALELLVTGKVDVVAGVRQHLVANAEKLPGSRVLDDAFMVIQQAIGIPKGRDAGAEYLCEFIEDAKASGFVAQAIAKAGIRGVSVPPARAGSA